MGKWKAQISLRVRQALRAELEERAAQERRKLGNVCEALLEWGLVQLKTAGSTEKLLQFQLSPKATTQVQAGKDQAITS